MVRKARDTGGPLVPYETASPGRLPRPRPREMVRKARDTGGPLVPYETASPGRLPRPRPREMVRKARDTGGPVSEDQISDLRSTASGKYAENFHRTEIGRKFLCPNKSRNTGTQILRRQLR
ncbi:hypothetical protein DPMN_018699 [Dreissena polymorpha]|uniref:Uncharacterized protein n=1 Tax=Dreissena polymorpha TaxID=45954 RepID=A0A9D4S7J2_DREPO|nr:hypothetical protein DPMN_018699 [Dreissena polymorpha]